MRVFIIGLLVFLQFIQVRIVSEWAVPVLTPVEKETMGVGKITLPLMMTFFSCQGSC